MMMMMMIKWRLSQWRMGKESRVLDFLVITIRTVIKDGLSLVRRSSLHRWISHAHVSASGAFSVVDEWSRHGRARVRLIRRGTIFLLSRFGFVEFDDAITQNAVEIVQAHLFVTSAARNDSAIVRSGHNRSTEGTKVHISLKYARGHHRAASNFPLHIALHW